ncbi:hypothetical protein P8C59_008679 [Phyllachora maydis]|uniref:Uncharacterized protein n=1 Tax=Phyllachora maydis TaxID=1825666 RepID=A0AAD9ICR7_9PEZI|nr:hypothetical protein P8C59_008679 [Phyllachora maydis]
MNLSEIFRTPSQRRQNRQTREDESLMRARYQELRERDQVWEATDFLKAFVKERWASHWPFITIDCGLTMEELRALGRLDKAQGIQECRRLVRVPVINEEIALALWTQLETDVRTADAEATRKTVQLIGDACTENIRTPGALVSCKEHGRMLEKENRVKRRERRREIEKLKHKLKTASQAQQPGKPTPVCVFCSESGRMRCGVSERRSVSYSPSESASSAGPSSTMSLLSRLRKALGAPPTTVSPTTATSRGGGRRRSNKSSRANSLTTSPVSPDGFWQYEAKATASSNLSPRAWGNSCPGSNTSASRPSVSRCSSRSSSSSSSSSDRVLGKLKHMAVQKSLAALGESLAYGYGSRPHALVAVSAKRCHSSW